VSELDEAWAFALAEAETRARMAGHVDLAAYLSLRSANDLLRSTGIQWLMNTCESVAAGAIAAACALSMFGLLWFYLPWRRRRQMRHKSQVNA